MSEQNSLDRRSLLGTLAAALAAAPFAGSWTAFAQAPANPKAPARPSRAPTPVCPAQTDRRRPPHHRLCRGWPRLWPAVILLHGWPYDIYAFADVAPLLAAAGYRVIVPYLRGYGTTRFRAADTPRNGQQARARRRCHRADGCAPDRQAIVAGFDWGARTADIVAALWPERSRLWSRSAAI